VAELPSLLITLTLLLAVVLVIRPDDGLISSAIKSISI